MEAAGPGHWRIAVKNNSPSPLRSEISHHTEGGRPPARRSLFLNPGTVTEFEYSLPPESGKAVLRLPTDAFPADNELLLVRSAPAPVAVSMEIPEQSGKIFRNIINSLRDSPPSRTAQIPTSSCWREKRKMPVPPEKRPSYLQPAANHLTALSRRNGIR